MKILHISCHHKAFDGRIHFKELCTLTDIGEVYFLSSSIDSKIRDVCGKEYEPGLYNDVTHVRYIFPPKAMQKSLKNNFLRRFIDLFDLKRKALKKIIPAEVARLPIIPDIIHFHEWELLESVVALKKKYQCKLIFDNHEMHLVRPFDLYPKKRSARFFYKRTKKAYDKYLQDVDLTLSVNKYIRAVLLTITPNNRHLLLGNHSVFSVSTPEKPQGKIILVHEGAVKFTRGLKLMVELFDDLWFRENVILKIIGGMGADERNYLDNHLKKNPNLNKNIITTGWVHYLEVESNMKGGHIGLVLMEPRFNNLLAGPPNKVYNYLASGMPVVSVDLPATTEIVEENEVGVIVERSTESIRAGINAIIDNYESLQMNIKRAENNFLWKTEAERLKNIYRDLLERKS